MHSHTHVDAFTYMHSHTCIHIHIQICCLCIVYNGLTSKNDGLPIEMTTAWVEAWSTPNENIQKIPGLAFRLVFL